MTVIMVAYRGSAFDLEVAGPGPFAAFSFPTRSIYTVTSYRLP